MQVKNNCALKVDFRNAFNSIKRFFFLEVIAAWLPQLLPTAWLYYSTESNVFSNEGIAFNSEEGAQQGDHVGNYAFSVVAKFINDRLRNLTFALKQFYVANLLLIADIDTLHETIKIITEIEDLAGVKINWSKTTLHCPTDETFTRAKSLFGNSITIVKSMNVAYLRCPIGDDDFVKEHLEVKLKELSKITKSLGEMPYLHEALTLLRYCGADARVTHLQRVVDLKY